MKSFILLSLSFLFTSYSFGQLDRGTFLLGGNGSFYNYNGEYISTGNTYKTKTSEIKINSSIGYFPIDKFAVGIRPSYYFRKGKTYINNTRVGDFGSNTQFLIGPFARYYFLDKEKQINILADVYYLFGSNSSPLPPETSGQNNEFSISTGIEAFFNSTVGIELLLGYKIKNENIKGTTGYTDKKKGFNIGIGFQIHLQN